MRQRDYGEYFQDLHRLPEGLEWIYTGDVGRIDAEGHLTVVDRGQEVIISGGRRDSK